VGIQCIESKFMGSKVKWKTRELRQFFLHSLLRRQMEICITRIESELKLEATTKTSQSFEEIKGLIHTYIVHTPILNYIL